MQTFQRDIAPGEKLILEEGIEIKGNVSAGAYVHAKKGPVIVHGTVGDKARLIADGPAGISNVFNGNSISVSGGGGRSIPVINGVVIVDGKVVSGGAPSNTSAQETPDITVKDSVGHGCRIQANGSAFLERDCGSETVVEVQGSIKGQNFGKKCILSADGRIDIKNAEDETSCEADGSVNADSLGNNCFAKADGSVKIDKIGSHTECKADGSVNVGTTGSFCKVIADGSVKVGYLGSNSTAKADGSAKVDVADETATVIAGGSVKIGRRSNSGSFEAQPIPPQASPKPQPPKPSSPAKDDDWSLII